MHIRDKLIREPTFVMSGEMVSQCLHFLPESKSNAHVPSLGPQALGQYS